MTSWQKSGTVIRTDNFHIDFKNQIGFAVSMWEMVLYCNYWNRNQDPFTKKIKMEIFKGKNHP